MENCSKCGSKLNKSTGLCSNCPKARLDFWKRFWVAASLIALALGLYLTFYAINVYSYFTCGAAQCVRENVQDLSGFVSAVGDGISELVMVILLQGTGIFLVVVGFTGLIISLVRIYKSNQARFSVSEANTPNN